MFNKSIIEKFLKIGIKNWLKSISTNIDIDTLKLIVNKENFSKIDQIYLDANDLIYRDLFVNRIIVQIYDCNLKFNYNNHLIYSEDLMINSCLTIDNRNLKNIFFSNKWQRLRIEIQNALTEGQKISNLFIKNDLITFSYDMDKLNKKVFLALNLKDNLIYLKNINNKNKLFLPLDANIKFNTCHIKNELINIDLSSRVIFDN